MKLFLVAACIGCAETPVEISYRGPDVTIERTSETFATTITVPTGGYQLRRDAIDVDGDLLQVRYTLEEPSPDEMVTQALVELRDDIEVSEGIRRVHVLVARVIRGAHYVVAPRHELAAVFDR